MDVSRMLRGSDSVWPPVVGLRPRPVSMTRSGSVSAWPPLFGATGGGGGGRTGPADAVSAGLGIGFGGGVLGAGGPDVAGGAGGGGGGGHQGEPGLVQVTEGCRLFLLARGVGQDARQPLRIGL